MMNTLWFDFIAATGQLCINILALRRWKKDNSTASPETQSLSQARKMMDDSTSKTTPNTTPIVVDVNCHTENTNRFVSPYTVVSLCMAVILTLRSILRFHLYRIISAPPPPPPASSSYYYPSYSHGANVMGTMGFLWLGGGIIMHFFMSIFFMYNIVAGGNPKKKVQVVEQ